MRIRKSGCIKLNWTCCYTEKFNVALSLCGVLGVTLYFSKGFSEEFLADEATGDGFALFWEAMVGLEVEAFPCFQKWNLRASFSTYLAWWRL